MGEIMASDRGTGSTHVEEMEFACSGDRWSTVGEIEEHSAELGEMPDQISASDGENGSGEDVYVAVGKSSSSMVALDWALNNVAKPQSFVYLIHVFPEVHRIPTPLGRLPKDQVRPEQVENYMNQERNKRSELLQKFLNRCVAAKVNVDTVLIESDTVPKAILELIPILNIRNLVVGTGKSNAGKLEKNGTAELIQRSAPAYCRVNVLCEGKEAVASRTASPSPTAETGNASGGLQGGGGVGEKGSSFSCGCFSTKFT